MSVVRKDYGALLEIFVGSEKTFALTVKDPDTGLALNLSDTSDYATAEVKIVKADGTIIVTVTGTYADRVNGIVEFTITDATTILANAGNWKGDLELSSDVPKIVEQQLFNFNILEST